MTTTPHPAILVRKDLEQMTGYTRLADIETELRSLGIPFSRGNRGIRTTVEAANSALLARAPVPAAKPGLEF